MRPAQDLSPRGSTTLVDVLDRVLDKGLVLAGDIRIALADVELLTIRIRLLVCSIDKAEEIGLDWWKSDPELSSAGRALALENAELRERLKRLEERLEALPPAPAADGASQPTRKVPRRRP